MACWNGQRNNDMMKDADICRTQWEKLGSWFIGPSAENIDEFCDLAIETIKRNGKPQNYFPDDKTCIPVEMKSSKIYKMEMAKLKTELKSLNDALTESIPLANIRYQGHMVSDTMLSARLGFLSAWMTNANNATAEIGPVTTRLETEVGKQLCDLFGFELTNDPRGYITTGGSSANIEALWTSRNVKFFPLAVQKAIQSEAVLASAKELSVYIPRLDRKQKILSTSTWDLLNLNLDDVIALHQEIDHLIKNDDIDFSHINKYSLTYNGLVQFFKLHNLTSEPVVIASAASHFSWDKAATLLGIGDHHLIRIPFDNNTRIDVVALQKLLDECLAKRVPVIAVVCVIGTTEHGAVDPVDAILNLRAEYRTKNKVIGLHSSGYGRILGQSVFGAKLFYCAWLTVAKPDDNFVCIPLIPIDEAYEEEIAKQFIRERILGKSYEDLSLATVLF
ncbi:L-tyrosine decarboxylase-like [Pecten maximus]|uniref:L-tyrosine decarboxylase-like n=1 Tax=Pecten maximus TaxID=6579 RepID=UPI0014583F02|nr:L-tyrosine decarboxylase-like [Pecten maximus]